MMEYVQILGNEVYKILFLLVPILVSVAMIVWLDRRVWGLVQKRKGPNVVGPFGALPVDSNGLYEPFIHKLDTIENVQSCFWLDVEHNVLTRYLKKFSDLLTMLEEKQLISSSGLAPMKEAVEEAKMNARKEYVKDQIEIARDTLGCEPRALYVLVGQNHFVARVKWYTGQCYLCDDLGGRVEKIDDLFAGVDYFKIFGILFVQVNKAAD